MGGSTGPEDTYNTYFSYLVQCKVSLLQCLHHRLLLTLGDTITYRATGLYRALSYCLIGRWATAAGVQLQLESANYVRLKGD